MDIQITKNTSLDSFVIVVLVGFALAVVGMLALFSWASEIQQEGIDDIERMGCGELKDFILNKGWLEYNVRTSIIKNNAVHQYTWMCEK